jgi:hypothetical protein
VPRSPAADRTQGAQSLSPSVAGGGQEVTGDSASASAPMMGGAGTSPAMKEWVQRGWRRKEIRGVREETLRAERHRDMLPGGATLLTKCVHQQRPQPDRKGPAAAGGSRRHRREVHRRGVGEEEDAAEGKGGEESRDARGGEACRGKDARGADGRERRGLAQRHHQLAGGLGRAAIAVIMRDGDGGAVCNCARGSGGGCSDISIVCRLLSRGSVEAATCQVTIAASDSG